MREIFDQDRAMTLGAVKQATGVLAILFLVLAVFAILSGLGQIFSGHIIHGIGRIRDDECRETTKHDTGRRPTQTTGSEKRP